MKEKIYIAYVVTTYKHDDEMETQTTDLVKAFSNKDSAISWARMLKEQTKEKGYVFMWNENETRFDYSASLTELWDSNKNEYVTLNQPYTRKWEIRIEGTEINDDVQDPYDEATSALN